MSDRWLEEADRLWDDGPFHGPSRETLATALRSAYERGLEDAAEIAAEVAMQEDVDPGASVAMTIERDIRSLKQAGAK
jgi:hypothetical protein